MAASNALRDLAATYGGNGKRSSFEDLRRLAGDYVAARGVSVLDAAAIGLAFDVVFSEATIDIAKITPDMAQAWHLAYPNVPIESLAGRAPEELAGAISGWKGKLFEVEVERRLNEGEWVGDLHLEPGQYARLAESPTQPGWDIQIFDESGIVSDAIQLKATESVSYVHEALARYPDTPILATTEVASRMGHESVIDSGISNDSLTDSLHDQVVDTTSDAVTDGIIGTLPVSIILATEAYKVLSGKKSAEEAVASGGDRIAKGAISAVVAGAVSVVATPLAGAVAGFLTRLALGEENVQRPQDVFLPPSIPRMSNRVASLYAESSSIAAHYPVEQTAKRKTDRSPDRSILTDREELKRLVDRETWLEIERDSMPLSSWLEQKISANMFSMSEAQLEDHLSDLRLIKEKGLAQTVHQEKSFVEKMWDGLTLSHRKLEKDLDTALFVGQLLLKKFSGTFSESDADSIAWAQMTPFERGRVEGEKAAKKRRNAFIRKALETLSIEQVKEIYPDAFDAAGNLRE